MLPVTPQQQQSQHSSALPSPHPTYHHPYTLVTPPYGVQSLQPMMMQANSPFLYQQTHITPAISVGNSLQGYAPSAMHTNNSGASAFTPAMGVSSASSSYGVKVGAVSKVKDKLKHSKSETRRRTRLRNQFELLRETAACAKKDRYNILAAAILRIQQLETERDAAQQTAVTSQRSGMPLLSTQSVVSGVATCVLDNAGLIIDKNVMFDRVFGTINLPAGEMTTESASASSIYTLVHPSGAHAVMVMMAQMTAGTLMQYSAPHKFMTNSGDIIDVHMVAWTAPTNKKHFVCSFVPSGHSDTQTSTMSHTIDNVAAVDATDSTTLTDTSTTTSTASPHRELILAAFPPFGKLPPHSTSSSSSSSTLCLSVSSSLPLTQNGGRSSPVLLSSACRGSDPTQRRPLAHSVSPSLSPPSQLRTASNTVSGGGMNAAMIVC